MGCVHEWMGGREAPKAAGGVTIVRVLGGGGGGAVVGPLLGGPARP